MVKPDSISSILLRRLLLFIVPVAFALASIWTIMEFAGVQECSRMAGKIWLDNQRAMARNALSGALASLAARDGTVAGGNMPFSQGGWQHFRQYLQAAAGDEAGFFYVLDAAGKVLYDSADPDRADSDARPFAPEQLSKLSSRPGGMILEFSLLRPGSGTREAAEALVRKVPDADYYVARAYLLNGNVAALEPIRHWQDQLVRSRLVVGLLVLALFAFVVLLYFRRLVGNLADQNQKVIQYLQKIEGSSDPGQLDDVWAPEVQLIARLARSIVERERTAIHRQLAHESRYRSLFHTSGESIIMHAPDGTIFEMNEQARLLLSRMNLWAEGSVSQVAQVKDLFPPGMSENLDRHLELLRRTSFAHFEGQVQAPAGIMYMEMSSYAVDPEANLAQTLIRDTTNLVQNRQKIETLNRELARLVDHHAHELDRSREELQNIQQELVQKEKLSLLVTVLASLGHEMETPLGIGVSLSTMFMERCREIRRAQDNGDLTRQLFADFLHNMEESSRILLDNMERAGELMRNLKELAVDQATAVAREFALRDYLNKIIQSLKPRLRRTPHVLELECPESLFVRGNPGSMYQILVNLINNSLVHAFGEQESGRMLIRVEADKSMIYIRYMDNGAGIPAEIQSRVFEPYFTTRRGSGGSGLGLHIIKTLVEQDFAGTVELEQLQGWSTCFLIRLPRP